MFHRGCVKLYTTCLNILHNGLTVLACLFHSQLLESLHVENLPKPMPLPLCLRGAGLKRGQESIMGCNHMLKHVKKPGGMVPSNVVGRGVVNTL